MIGEEWVEKVRRFRIAVDAYCDAVDRSGRAGDLGEEWQKIEVAHDEAERARSAVIRATRKPMLARTRSVVCDEASDHGIDQLVLGDLGQHGG